MSYRQGIPVHLYVQRVREHLAQCCPGRTAAALATLLHKCPNLLSGYQASFLSESEVDAIILPLFRNYGFNREDLIANLPLSRLAQEMRDALLSTEHGYRALADTLPEIANMYPQQYAASTTQDNVLCKLATAIKTAGLVIEVIPNIVPDIKQVRLIERDVAILRALLCLLGWDVGPESTARGVCYGNMRIDFIDSTAIITDTGVDGGDENSLRFYGIFP